MNDKRVFLVLCLMVFATVVCAIVFAAPALIDKPGEKVKLLKEYGIEFEDSPQIVAKKLGVSIARGASDEGVTTEYRYQAKLFGYDAEMWFSFYKNIELTNVSIIVQCEGQEEAEKLKQELILVLLDSYSTKQNFYRSDTYHSFYSTVVTEISLLDGPYGMSYVLYVSCEDLVLSCSYQYN